MQEKSRKRKELIVWLITILAIILVVILGTKFKRYINYYIPSVIIMGLLMVPFFYSFEKRKPNARELVTLAIMCAIAVISRAAFVWAPSFKPIAGIITITAICFGPSAGFIVGAMSMFASNMIFGQGVWTIWQMFAFGMHGFVSGILARSGILSPKKLIRTALISALIYLVITGVILDICSIFLMPTTMTLKGILAIFASGFPVNLSQSICTFITVFLLLKPMSDILNRIKTKYGILNQEI